MDESRERESQERLERWNASIASAMRAVERFFWNLMWFVVLVFILFSFNPFR